MRSDRPTSSGTSVEWKRTILPSSARAADEGEDLLLRADVDASRRVVEQDHAGADLEPLADHDLLLVAAREVVHLRPRRRRLDLQRVRSGGSPRAPARRGRARRCGRRAPRRAPARCSARSCARASGPGDGDRTGRGSRRAAPTGSPSAGRPAAVRERHGTADRLADAEERAQQIGDARALDARRGRRSRRRAPRS